MTEVGQRDVSQALNQLLLALEMEEGDHKPGTLCGLLKLEKSRKGITPYSLQKGMQPY